MPKLLLVDDGEANRWTLSALLEDEGFEVDTAGSFSEARALLAAGEPRYDVALLDLHLGDGLGANLVPLLRARHPEAKVVMMSGCIGEEPLSEPVDGCFQKAEDFSALVELLDRVRDGRG
jgi:DNA-binding NtrC family response regulator